MRPPWDIYFLQFAKLASSRSTCTRRHHGAVIVLDNQILATGYNASPSRFEHCDDGCLRQARGVPSGTRYELCRSIHAEQNALLQAAKHGVRIAGATMYITGYPCMMCARLIANSGIKRVVISDDSLMDPDAELVMKVSGIPLEVIEF